MRHIQWVRIGSFGFVSRRHVFANESSADYLKIPKTEKLEQPLPAAVSQFRIFSNIPTLRSGIPRLHLVRVPRTAATIGASIPILIPLSVAALKTWNWKSIWRSSVRHSSVSCPSSSWHRPRISRPLEAEAALLAMGQWCHAKSWVSVSECRWIFSKELDDLPCLRGDLKIISSTEHIK